MNPPNPAYPPVPPPSIPSGNPSYFPNGEAIPPALHTFPPYPEVRTTCSLLPVYHTCPENYHHHHGYHRHDDLCHLCTII